MSDFIWKLHVLLKLMDDPYYYWKESILPYDPDSYLCCNGGSTSATVCGCGGMTIRECYGENENDRS